MYIYVYIYIYIYIYRIDIVYIDISADAAAHGGSAGWSHRKDVERCTGRRHGMHGSRSGRARRCSRPVAG